MEKNDIARCIRVRTLVRENPFSFENLVKAGITEESVARMLGDTHQGWVCEAHGQIVGFSMGNKTNSEFWVVAVLPEYQGQGIGKRLTVLAQDWLWANGCSEIWLWTSPDQSTRAYSLYKKLGWMDCDIRDGQRIMKLTKSAGFGVGLPAGAPE
jgi:ribosomal protein S18 acetylase RimI-like enzyme